MTPKEITAEASARWANKYGWKGEVMTPEEVKRRWDLPGDHPDSWIQRNATYRGIWNKATEAAYEDAARIAEWPCPVSIPPAVYEVSYAKGRNDAAAAIRARKP